MPSQSTIRANKCHQKKLDAGLIRIPVWVPKGLAEEVREYARKLCKADNDLINAK